MSKQLHPMRVAMERSGLTSHAIRVWEKRHSAISPHRTETNHRLFSDEDIERLGILRDLTEIGHAISTIAHLSTEDLRKRQVPLDQPEARTVFEVYVTRGLTMCRNLDVSGLSDVIDEAAVKLGYSGLIERVIAPLIIQIGEEWHNGTITAAQEHAATEIIRDQVNRHSRSTIIPENAPGIVIATPAGQIHEMGAVLAAATARKAGWRVTYLGSSLPAAEIAGAVIQHDARLLALSIVYPTDDPELAGELKILRELIPIQVSIIAGGRASAAYADALKQIGASCFYDLVSYRAFLSEARTLVPT